MLVLTRKGNEVFHDGKKLTIVAQASKGPGKEVVKVDGLPGSNGQKWVSLSTLKEGMNEIQAKGREVTSSGGSYSLTPEEAKRVAELRAELDAIIAGAKARFVPKPKLDVNPDELTEAEKLAKLEEIKKFYGL